MGGAETIGESAVLEPRSLVGISRDGALCGIFGREVRLVSTEKTNVEPSPGVDATPMRPPWSSVKSREMKSPRPLPPYLLSVLGLASVKR